MGHRFADRGGKAYHKNHYAILLETVHDLCCPSVRALQSAANGDNYCEYVECELSSGQLTDQWFSKSEHTIDAHTPMKAKGLRVSKQRV